MIKKWIVVGIILLLLHSSIPSLANTEKTISLPTSNGKWLYVGGNGPGNYTKIQDAIDDTSDGDTILVFSGMYYETYIVVNKSIDIIGENKDTTIIDGGGYGTVIGFYADEITFTGFTVQNGGNDFFAFDSGVKVGKSHDVTITGNIIADNPFIGLFVYAQNCLVSQNTITNNNLGILVFPDPKGHVMICGNTVESNCVGIDIAALNVSVFRNEIHTNLRSIRITESSNISIVENNFRRNENQPIFVQLAKNATKWNENYWDRPRLLPKLIFGMRYRANGKTIYWINFDWFPAREPYDIGGIV
ncbi:MAG: right-handed parallel beta-helix repeat-containing protein [Candidatus Thermoplasmatota archaeon]|nr:right-handed parallel beta-helix repeat-containing protein [Candidatus Thermoplasmatota archaeon]